MDRKHVDGLPKYTLFLQGGLLALLSLGDGKIIETWVLPLTAPERYRITLSRLGELNNILEAFLEQLELFVGTGNTSWIAARFTTSLLRNLKLITKEDT